MEECMFGIGGIEVRKMAYQLAEKNNIKHPFKNGAAGKDWLAGFLKRNKQLSIRSPEATSAARAKGFNKVAVNKFFNILEPLMAEHNFSASHIYNVDETGLSTVPNKPSKIIALRGRRQVGTLTSAERGQLVTVEVCISPTGNFIPPMFVFPRKRMKPELMDDAPEGSVYACHKSGWMQLEIFTEWMKHFIATTGASKDNKVLLILDGHKTHTMNLEAITLAKENGVTMLCIPPHCSHRMQPLDVSFMKPLSTYYTQATETWLRNHPGRTITTFQVAMLFKQAYQKAATCLNAASGFRRAGIFPTNRYIFKEHEFAAAEVTNIPIQHVPRDEVNIDSVMLDSDINTADEVDLSVQSQLRTQQDPINFDTNMIDNDIIPEQESNETQSNEINAEFIILDEQPETNSIPTHIQYYLNDETGQLSVISKHDAEFEKTEVPDIGINSINIGTHLQGTSTSAIEDECNGEYRTPAKSCTGSANVTFESPNTSSYVSPYEISPIPKAPMSTQNRKKSRRRGSAKVLTESPYKESLIQAQADKNKKIKNKQERLSKQKRKKCPSKVKRKLDTRKNSVVCQTKYEEDCECIYCMELYSRSSGEDWIQCTDCTKWAHDACAGVEKNENSFVCEICLN